MLRLEFIKGKIDTINGNGDRYSICNELIQKQLVINRKINSLCSALDIKISDLLTIINFSSFPVGVGIPGRNGILAICIDFFWNLLIHFSVLL
ncbi:hypothetical protein D3C73_1394430 [compost metagenome]